MRKQRKQQDYLKTKINIFLKNVDFSRWGKQRGIAFAQTIETNLEMK